MKLLDPIPLQYQLHFVALLRSRVYVIAFRSIASRGRDLCRNFSQQLSVSSGFPVGFAFYVVTKTNVSSTKKLIKFLAKKVCFVLPKRKQSREKLNNTNWYC